MQISNSVYVTLIPQSVILSNPPVVTWTACGESVLEGMVVGGSQGLLVSLEQALRSPEPGPGDRLSPLVQSLLVRLEGSPYTQAVGAPLLWTGDTKSSDAPGRHLPGYRDPGGSCGQLYAVITRC